MQTLASLLMLTIRLYTSGDLAAADIAAAQRSADAIFQQALIDVEWTDCRKGPKKPRPLTCEAPLGDFEIVLRLTGTTPGGSQPAGDALGDAVLDTTTGRGALSTVYVNRVKSLAHASRTPEGELLEERTLGGTKVRKSESRIDTHHTYERDVREIMALS